MLGKIILTDVVYPPSRFTKVTSFFFNVNYEFYSRTIDRNLMVLLVDQIDRRMTPIVVIVDAPNRKLIKLNKIP